MLETIIQKIITLAVGVVHSFRSENICRTGDFFQDKADRDRVIRLLYERGWDAGCGLPIVWKLSGDWLKKGIAEREQEWERLKGLKENQVLKLSESDTIVLSAADYRTAWEALYTHKGKVIPPQYGTVAAYRRTEALPWVNAARFLQDKPGITELAYAVREYSSDAERYEDCIRENTRKLEGNRPMSNEDKLRSGLIMYQKGMNENALRKLFGAGMAQKLFPIYQLDSKFEGLNLIQNILSGKVAFGPLNKEKLRALVKENADQDTVQDYLDNPPTEGTKLLDSDRREGLATQNPNYVVREIVDMVHNGNTSVLDFYTNNAKTFNAVLTALRAGKQVQVVEPEAVASK